MQPEWHNSKIFSIDEARALAEREGKSFAFFYNNSSFLSKMQRGDLDMVNILNQVLRELGYHCVLVDGDICLHAEGLSSHLHFWMSGKVLEPSIAPNLFYLATAYFHGFWSLHRKGLRNLSDLVDVAYDPSQVPEAKANEFFARLHDKFVKGRKSNWEQSEDASLEIPKDCWAVASQGREKIAPYPSYVEHPELIAEVVAQKRDRPVWIKPHPVATLTDSLELAVFHDEDNSVYFEDCNLHDLLASAELLITRDSVVALEAMLYKIPAIVSAQVDFHHGVETIHAPDELLGAIQRLQARDFSYEKYLYWFFKMNHFEPSLEDETFSALKTYFVNALPQA